MTQKRELFSDQNPENHQEKYPKSKSDRQPQFPNPPRAFRNRQTVSQITNSSARLELPGQDLTPRSISKSTLETHDVL